MIHTHTQGKFGVDRRVILSETDRLVVCEAALKFSLSDRGLWDTSVSHCLLCLVFTPLRRDYTGAAVALDETSRDKQRRRDKSGCDEECENGAGKRRRERKRNGRRERKREGERGEAKGQTRLSLSLHCLSTALL